MVLRATGVRMAHGEYEVLITEAMKCLDKFVEVQRPTRDFIQAVRHAKERLNIWFDFWIEALEIEMKEHERCQHSFGERCQPEGQRSLK